MATRPRGTLVSGGHFKREWKPEQRLQSETTITKPEHSLRRGGWCTKGPGFQASMNLQSAEEHSAKEGRCAPGWC